MAFIYADRVKETSVSVGTGNFVLDGAVASFQTFNAAIGTGNETYYTIFNEVDDTWEVGIGMIVGPVLFRTTVIVSINGIMPVDFAIGQKTVFAGVAGEYFASVLSAATHTTLSHVGITGVPAPESFTESLHALTDHTSAPFDLIDDDAHNMIDHTIAPFDLVSIASHLAVNHFAVPGVNNFSEPVHDTTDHTGILGVPVAEAFTEAVHAVTDHIGIPGVTPPIPAPDVAAEVIAGSDPSDSVTIALTNGTWFVACMGSFRSINFDGNSLSASSLRIGGVSVSSIVGNNGSVDGVEYYTHFGFRTGIPGDANITADFDIRDTNTTYQTNMGIQSSIIFAIRTG